MKQITKYLQGVSLCILIIGCSKPTLEEAIKSDDESSIKEIIKSGEFDPNISPDDSDITLFEYIIRKYNEPELAEKIASHPDLTEIVRNEATKSLLREIRTKKDELVIDDPDRWISLDAFAKSLYLLIKPLSESASTLAKKDLTDQLVMIYGKMKFYLFDAEGHYTTVKFDKPYETRDVLDVQEKPEYKDVIPSSPGKELIFYILHPSRPGPKNYVKVFADPVATDLDGMTADFWNDKLLFAAVPPWGYTFDGSMNFPEGTDVQYNTIRTNLSAGDNQGEIGSNQFDEDWEFLLEKRWYALLKDAEDGPRKYIEPSCLSTTALIEFYGAETLEKLRIGAGQDALDYNVQSTEKSNASLTIKFAQTSFGETTPTKEMVITKSEGENSSERITISLKIDDINDLLFGYYPDNIIALNQNALVYIADENDLFPYLRDRALLSRLPCEEEEEY